MGHTIFEESKIKQLNHPVATISTFLWFVFILLVSNCFSSEQYITKLWKNPPEKVIIDDDFSYIFQQDTSSQLTVVQILIKGGKRIVPLSKRGLAFLTTRLAVELPSWEDFKHLMELGSSMFYHVEGDFTRISIRCLSEHLDETLEFILQSIKKPLFSGMRIENVKKYMEHRIKGEDDAPDQLMELTFFNSFFNGDSNTYSGSIFGNSDSLDSIKKKDILNLYNSTFNYTNMIITVCSDLDKATLTPIIDKQFSSISVGKSYPLIPIRVNQPETKKIYLKKNTKQVLISFGALLPEISRKEYAMIYMLENLLGKGIGCKLWPLRAQKKLAYGLDTRFIQLQGAGILTILLKTNIAKKQAAYHELKNLLNEFYTKGLTLEDLLIARTLSRADFLRDNETKEKRAGTLSYFEAMGLGFHFLEEFLLEVDKVTLEDLNNFLQQTLNPDQLLVVAIGPEDSLEETNDESSLESADTGSKI